jgi:predicted metal-dependent phosphoesterase TrpH
MKAFCRESYSEPEAVYEKLKRRGMGLVTITDHDSIGALEPLRSRPDFFVSEEVTCTLANGTQMHVGVYDITDCQHVELQRRRHDLDSLLAYLREQKLFFSANHIFSSLTGERMMEDFELFEREFDAVEVLNGCMLEITNRNAQEFARVRGKVALGGSDAHTLATAGACWTEVPGARNKAEFFAGLRKNRSLVAGRNGSYFKLTRDILQIGMSMVRSNPVTAPVALLGWLAPIVTLFNYALEKRFSQVWMNRLSTETRIPVVQEAAA